MMKGGENYPAVVPMDPQASELYVRVTLPKDSEEYMPRDGKTPLTAEQIQIIAWWIEIGAPESGLVSSLKPSADVLTRIEKELAR